MKQSEALDMITKIRLAQQAMESAWKRVDELKEENKKLKEALAKQEQDEPVAIVDANDDGYWADILPDRTVKVGQLLYTTPQQRTWVGLTDDEFEDIEMSFTPTNKIGAMMAVEAKLKEKNT